MKDFDSFFLTHCILLFLSLIPLQTLATTTTEHSLYGTQVSGDTLTITLSSSTMMMMTPPYSIHVPILVADDKKSKIECSASSSFSTATTVLTCTSSEIATLSSGIYQVKVGPASGTFMVTSCPATFPEKTQPEPQPQHLFQVAGPKGATGPRGATGPIGTTGLKGLTGPGGGPVGPKGPTGPKGLTGVKGPTGLGAVGPTGSDGTQGLIGPTGPGGPPGGNGTGGSAGPAGPTGANGATGATGTFSPSCEIIYGTNQQFDLNPQQVRFTSVFVACPVGLYAFSGGGMCDQSGISNLNSYSLLQWSEPSSLGGLGTIGVAAATGWYIGCQSINDSPGPGAPVLTFYQYAWVICC